MFLKQIETIFRNFLLLEKFCCAFIVWFLSKLKVTFRFYSIKIERMFFFKLKVLITYINK